MDSRADEQTALQGEESTAYRWYVVSMLLLVFVFANLDRQVLNVLVEPVKAEFGLSDKMMGLLTGAAFAMFYAVLGVPLAIVADRFSRRNLISAAITVWSAMTVVCGMAATAGQLILARIGVAVGEAGSNPASQSMIADLFPPARRATPMALLAMGPNLGIMAGFIAGGWIGEAFGWRMAFIAVGVPGLLVGLLFLLTVREPRRGQADGIGVVTGGVGKLGGLPLVLRTLVERPSFALIVAGFCMAGMFGYGAIAWLAAFFDRSYGMSGGTIATIIGLVVGIGGAIGTFSGGLLADRLGRRDVRWRLWVICIAGTLAIPLSVASFLVFDPWLTLALIAFPASVAVFHSGPSFALVQGLVDPRIRAISAAFLLFVLNFVGGAAGPFYVGVLSDFLTPSQGAEALRYAMLALAVPMAISMICYFLAARTLARDLQAAGSVH